MGNSPLNSFFPNPTFLCLVFACSLGCQKKTNPPLPTEYKQGGAYIKKLPFHKPDSCALLILRDVPRHWQGAVYQNLFLDGPDDSSLELAFLHLDVYEKNFPADTAREFAQCYRGRFYAMMGKFDSAQICCEDSYQSAIRNNRPVQASDALLNKAGIFFEQGNVAQAIRTQLTAFETIENLDSSHNFLKYLTMVSLSGTYSKSVNLREALRWGHRALALLQTDHSPALEGFEVDVYSRLTGFYTHLQMLDSAWITGQKALEWLDKYPNRGSRDRTLILLGNILFKKGDCAAALRYYRESLRMAQAQSFSHQQKIWSQPMADAYLCLGKLDSAEILLKDVLPHLRGRATEEGFALIQLSNVYAKKGNFRAAYEALDSSFQTRKTYFSPEKIAEFGAIKSELELERSERKAEKLDDEKRNAQQQSLILALAGLLTIGFLVSLFLRQRSRRQILEQEKQLLEQEKELAEAYGQLQTKALERSQNQLQQTQEELDHTAQLLELKNQLIEELQLRNRHLTPDDELRRMKILTDEDWGKFRERFEQSFPNFLKKLKTEFPAITAAETRLFLLYKLQFSNQEIADTLGISVESVWRSRHRLGKKIGISETGTLEVVVAQFN